MLLLMTLLPILKKLTNTGIRSSSYLKHLLSSNCDSNLKLKLLHATILDILVMIIHLEETAQQKAFD